ncbi:hypothetical protein SAMN05878443_1906 [Carnobacterium alterfunditum]|uniref:O-Antigen ligase n=1 Tax=Carnobacterium alterfunditum TaxID=28230 RepID=A0A1N6HK14_9LACT|nr:hypothetical protein SAMN05878443_1906 [Carnobacterium alterfunditum]
MEEISILTKWLDFNKKNSRFWSNIILFLMSISFVVTDWMIVIFTVSDYIFALVGISLFISGNYKIKRRQLLWILLILGVIAANIVMNVYNNEAFVLKTGTAAFIRVSYYVAIIVGVYNYVKDQHLETRFLKTLNIIAIIVCFIGIYITIALYSEGQLPYEFFWKFTRTDLASFVFKENTALIRTRSIFSEPAYLGYFLNVILTMNYFNGVHVKINKSFSVIISLTLLLTFSYSAIGIMLMIQFLNLVYKIRLKKFKWTNKTTVYVLLLVGIIMFSWDFIDETLIKRTAYIISGEDISAYNRIISSWSHINSEHIFLGNGIGHTPNVWNIYAYILSDLGLIAFILSCLFSLYLLLINFRLGMIFIVLNFQKGGYLNPAFSILLLLIFIYIEDKNQLSRSLNPKAINSNCDTRNLI